MLIPTTEREALLRVMNQAENDLKSAHAEICKLQGVDPATHTWPEWSPQANSLRWFDEIRAKFYHSMTETQIKYMVDRFLGWRLPESFNPDGGISFKKTFNDHMPQPMKNEPTGTNVFDADQATIMVRYMVEGMPTQ